MAAARWVGYGADHFTSGNTAMLLRKLIVFAITSGLAKKAYDHFSASRAAKATARATPRQPDKRGATVPTPPTA
jgi:hypothetical protein